MKKQLHLLLALFLCCIFAFGGCTAGPTDPAPDPTPTPAPSTPLGHSGLCAVLPEGYTCTSASDTYLIQHDEYELSVSMNFTAKDGTTTFAEHIKKQETEQGMPAGEVTLNGIDGYTLTVESYDYTYVYYGYELKEGFVDIAFFVEGRFDSANIEIATIICTISTENKEGATNIPQSAYYITLPENAKNTLATAVYRKGKDDMPITMYFSGKSVTPTTKAYMKKMYMPDLETKLGAVNSQAYLTFDQASYYNDNEVTRTYLFETNQGVLDLSFAYDTADTQAAKTIEDVVNSINKI